MALYIHYGTVQYENGRLICVFALCTFRIFALEIDGGVAAFRFQWNIAFIILLNRLGIQRSYFSIIILLG